MNGRPFGGSQKKIGPLKSNHAEERRDWSDETREASRKGGRLLMEERLHSVLYQTRVESQHTTMSRGGNSVSDERTEFAVIHFNTDAEGGANVFERPAQREGRVGGARLKVSLPGKGKAGIEDVATYR